MYYKTPKASFGRPELFMIVRLLTKFVLYIRPIISLYPVGSGVLYDTMR